MPFLRQKIFLSLVHELYFFIFNLFRRDSTNYVDSPQNFENSLGHYLLHFAMNKVRSNHPRLRWTMKRITNPTFKAPSSLTAYNKK